MPLRTTGPDAADLGPAKPKKKKTKSGQSKPAAPPRASTPARSAPAPVTSENTPRKKVKVRRPVQDTRLTPDTIGIENPLFKPVPAPPHTDWRKDPGGGYVDTRSGRTMPLAPDRETRKLQERWFQQTKRLERLRHARVPDAMRRRWAAEAEAKYQAEPWRYGLPFTDADIFGDNGLGTAWQATKGIGGAVADWEKTTWGNMLHGRFLQEAEREMTALGGRSLANTLFHGDISHPGATLAEAALLPVPFLKGTPMVATVGARAAGGARMARAAVSADEGLNSLRLMARATNMTRSERRAFLQDTAVLQMFQTSAGRQALSELAHARLPAPVADAFMESADAQAITVHRQLSHDIEAEIAALDKKVANGTATEDEIIHRKELGLMQRFGVPADYYYRSLQETGSGIPDWIRAKYQRDFPDLNFNFKFEGPTRAGPHFTSEAIAKRLKMRLNPKNMERGLTVNPVVRAADGVQYVGPISDKEWLARVKKFMPSRAERTYWATWYQSFEPLFRQVFGEDADAIMSGFAASQANTSPAGGIGAVLKVMDRIRRGEEVTKEGIGMIAFAVEDAVKGTPLEEGMAAKLSDFTDALAQKSTRTWMGDNPLGAAPAPSDIWAARDMGYVDPKYVGYLEKKGLVVNRDFVVDSPGAPQGSRYEHITNQYNRIAEMLNKVNKGKGFDGHQWTPADVQALGWGTIQKAVGANPEDLIFALERNAYEVAGEVTKGVTGIGADLSIGQARHVTELMEPEIRQLIEETPGVYLMPVEQPFKFTTGGWAGGQNGSVQFKVIGAKNDVQKLIERFAQAFDQEYVQATRQTSSAAAEPKSALIITSDAFKSESAKQRFFEALAAESPESAPARGLPKEPELQGYMSRTTDKGEAIVIRTHKGTATGKAVDPFLGRYRAAITAAEKKTGIKTQLDHENLAMIVGGQHGAVNALESAPGAAGGRGVDDPLAAGIRARLERAVAGVSAGATEAAPGLEVAARSDDIERHIAALEKQIDSAIKERARMLGGAEAFGPSGGKVTRPTREWEPGIGRRGAIGGRPGRYVEDQTVRMSTVRRSGWENAKAEAERQLIAEDGPTARLMDELQGLRLEREAGYPEWAQFSGNNRMLHGVHAYNPGEPGLPISPEMSGVYVSENTPLPTRVLAHEFFGHYVDVQILNKYPGARAVVDRLTEGMSKVEKAELFAKWQEEYILNGGGARLPAALKPALKTLSEQALEETSHYTGEAASRIYLPPEIEDLFDAMHGMEAITGERWVPGETTYGSMLSSLSAKLDEGAPMSADQAEQAVRYLRYGDKVQQIAGQARGRQYTRRLIERVADKISQSLSDEGFSAAVGNFLHISSEMRVSKAAGRELALEAERAAGRMHTAIDALPKEGNPEDVAHAIWAQLPADQRNVDGLTLVRDKHVDELRAYEDGSLHEEIITALDGAEADLKSMDWNSPEAWAQMKRIGQLRTLLTDLPLRREDLRKQIALLDTVILKDPAYDPKIVAAMDKLSADRERVLLEAGAPGADAERFAERKGLLSRWLGLEPSGEEVYVGHRMGKAVGDSARVTPGGAGVGRPLTPKGLSRANQLVLASTGRMRLSTHVVAEDWAKAEQYRNAIQQREDYWQMGKPFHPGERVPEDALLVNRNGRVIPRSWKTDPLSHLDDATEQELEKRVGEMASSFMAPGGESREALAAQEALILDIQERGLDLSDLRVVSKRAVENHAKRFLPYRGTSKGLTAYDQAVNVMSASLIFGRVGYIPKNIVQNVIMAVPHQGIFFVPNAMRAGALFQHPELWHKVAVETGGGATAALEREAAGTALKRTPRKALAATHWVAAGVTGVADTPLRASAFLHEAAAHGVIPKFTPYLRDEDIQALENLLEDPTQRPLLNRITQATRDHMGDFNRMTPVQRRIARRWLIIPGWLMAGSRYPIYFATTHPLRTAAIAYVAAGEPYADRLGLPQTPGIQNIYEEIGYNQGLRVPKGLPFGGKLLRTTSISPINTPYDIGRTILGKGTDDPFGYANPLIPIGINTARREGRYGQHLGLGAAALDNLQSIIPNWALAKGLAHPKSTGTYPGDRTRWGRLQRELGIFPIEIVPGGHAAKKKSDDWKEKVAEARKYGIKPPPGVGKIIRTKAEWESIKAKLGDASDEELARAKFELLVSVDPTAAASREDAYAAFANPEARGAADAETERYLGWYYLSEMSKYLGQAKRAKEARGG